MEIKIKEKDGKGYALANQEGTQAGMMSFNRPNNQFIIIDHTEVEEEFRGSDVGKQMLFKLVDMAREQDFKIFPLCPFANAMFRKIPEIRDVLKN